MQAMPSQHPQHELAFECIAAEAHVPVDDVSRLYAAELARLAANAQVMTFLPIFAIRHVRENLLGAHAPPRPPLPAAARHGAGAIPQLSLREAEKIA